MKIRLPKTKFFKLDWHVFVIAIILLFLATGTIFSLNKYNFFQNTINMLTEEKDKKLQELAGIKTELDKLKSTDQIKRNDDLEKKINNIETTYQKAVSVYENLLELKTKTSETADLDKLYTEALVALSEQNFDSANTTLDKLNTEIDNLDTKISSSFTIPASVPVNNAPPDNGYQRQQVSTNIGNYLVSMIAADLSTTRVLVDTASDSDCTNDCPVLPLAEYVSRNGGFAGINGTYFCPATYPSCAGKTNTFDLLVMNYKKTYFNSGNNVYSNNPAVIFGDGYIRFVSAASQWGRDTSPTGVLSNYPLTVFNSSVNFGGDDDPKKGSKGIRSFVGNKGNTVYIGVVHNVTVAESAIVLQALGLENALNLDSGGSTALYSSGYKVGPGRNIPNAIIFVKK